LLAAVTSSSPPRPTTSSTPSLSPRVRIH
jgi:hypothetical protein